MVLIQTPKQLLDPCLFFPTVALSDLKFPIALLTNTSDRLLEERTEEASLHLFIFTHRIRDGFLSLNKQGSILLLTSCLRKLTSRLLICYNNLR